MKENNMIDELVNKYIQIDFKDKSILLHVLKLTHGQEFAGYSVVFDKWVGDKTCLVNFHTTDEFYLARIPYSRKITNIKKNSFEKKFQKSVDELDIYIDKNGAFPSVTNHGPAPTKIITFNGNP